MTLDSLQVGERGVVVSIEGTDTVAVRLAEMGVIDGEEIELVGTAPFGDPLEFSLRGYRLSLRKAEAVRVNIEPLKSK
ncbi:MAG: ferrous iron transport protein A [Planctomycetaceae bacterium]|nr:ferrous iron transport protein A [Planctomycetaceae bacterium]MCB9949988.1 ferrous iron transport protein A [Planctomycetaceae bacterium]